MLNVLFNFVLVIAVILIGFDIITHSASPRFNALYRRVLRATYNYLRRNISRLVRWAWRNYKQFIIGTAFGFFLAKLCTGHFG